MSLTGISGIQEAIDSAVAGDTVVIREGEYRESVVVNKPLTVRGDTTSGPVVIVRLPSPRSLS